MLQNDAKCIYDMLVCTDWSMSWEASSLTESIVIRHHHHDTHYLPPSKERAETFRSVQETIFYITYMPWYINLHCVAMSSFTAWGCQRVFIKSFQAFFTGTFPEQQQRQSYSDHQARRVQKHKKNNYLKNHLVVYMQRKHLVFLQCPLIWHRGEHIPPTQLDYALDTQSRLTLQLRTEFLSSSGLVLPHMLHPPLDSMATTLLKS